MLRTTGINPRLQTMAGIVGALVLGVAALVVTATPAAAAAATPVLYFSADGGEWIDGTLEAGGPVLVDYDMARLPNCRNRYAGGDAWSIGVYYRVDGGPITRQPVTRLDENRQNLKAPARIDLPLDGRDLEMWFHAGDRAGCGEYDSRFGANYHYAIEQPG
jgi:hypothetical protein